MSPVDVLRALRRNRLAALTLARGGMRKGIGPADERKATARQPLRQGSLAQDRERRPRNRHLFFIRTYGHISNNQTR
jgi:hypothetical protein